MSHVVIIGTGDCPADAVKESLADALSSGDEVSVAWPKSMNGAMDAVLEYLVDNEYSTNLLYSEGQNVHPDLRQIDTVSVVKVRDTESSLVKSIDNEVLILWNDADEELLGTIFDSNENVRVRELSNGLAPIVVEYHPDTPEPAALTEEEHTEEDDNSRFTREQLEGMAVPAVKRYGEKLGLTSKTKSGIIEELFGAEEAPAETPSTLPKDDPTPPPPAPNDSDFVRLYHDFTEYADNCKDFESSMAKASLEQARLWMLRALSRIQF